MAANLLREFPGLAVYNRSSPPRDRLQKSGARGFANSGPFFAGCDAVILMLADEAAVDEVFGRGTPDFGTRATGRLIINMGTHSPQWSARLERDVRAAGGSFVEAPVSGSRGPAESANLVAMVAGAPEAISAATPALDAMCREVIATGRVPSAMACKLAVNSYLIASVAALGEAAALSRLLGLPPDVFERVVSGGPLGSDVARAKLLRMTTRDFSAQASIRDVCKNAMLVEVAAESVGAEVPLLAHARQLFEAVRSSGGGEFDMAAIVTAFEGGGKAT